MAMTAITTATLRMTSATKKCWTKSTTPSAEPDITPLQTPLLLYLHNQPIYKQADTFSALLLPENLPSINTQAIAALVVEWWWGFSLLSV
jgi:hypothetical protein